MPMIANAYVKYEAKDDAIANPNANADTNYNANAGVMLRKTQG